MGARLSFAWLFSGGHVERSKRPDLRLLENQTYKTESTGFEIKFGTTDSVLAAIAKGRPIKARFGEQEQSFPAPSQAFREEFANRCAALLPSGLRKG